MRLRASAVLALALVLTALSLAQAVHRAGQGRCALLKWRAAIEQLPDEVSPYAVDPGAGRESFPMLPLTALLLSAFLGLGDLPGAFAWAAFKLGLAWWSVLAALQLAAGRARDFPPWGALIVLLLSARVIASDVAHGNVNLPVAAVLVAAALAWSRGRELQAGLWIAFGAVLKATPLLFALYFLRKRSWRALAGTLLGIALFAFAVPALLLGWDRNLELAGLWWSQMAAPYLAGDRLELMQSEHTNQSLLGVLARLATDAVAIQARPPELATDVRVNLLALSGDAFVLFHRSACALALLLALACTRAPRAGRASAVTLGEWSAVALAMLMLSERSWKQHYVTLFLPVAFLAWHALRAGSEPRARAVCWTGLAASAALHGLSGSGVVGALGSDLIEAYGAYLWGGVALFLACAWILGFAPEGGAAEAASTTERAHPSGSGLSSTVMQLAPLRIGVAAVALAAGGFLLWHFLRAPAAQSTGPSSAAVGEPAARSVEATPPPAPEDQPAAESPARAEVEAAPAQVAPQPETEPAARGALSGRVVVVELDGSENTGASGAFDVGVWNGDTGRAETVEFEGGTWSASFGDAGGFEKLSVEEVRIGGRPLQIEEPAGRFDPSAQGGFLVRVRRAPPSILRVVDAESGLELDGVSLVSSEDFPRADVVHPGPDFASRVVARDLSSPIALDAHFAGLRRYGALRFLVGALDHAWQLVELDPYAGGERVVALARGADLAVGVRGVDPAARAVLRLRADGRFNPLAEVELRQDGTLEFQGLAPGEVRVVAEVGEFYKSPLALGESAVALRAGERAQVDLVLEAAPALVTARAAGTVYVPQAWGVQRAQVVLELLDTPLAGQDPHEAFQAEPVASEREGYDAFRWAREGLQAGLYELGLGQPPFSVVLELPPQGSEALDLVVPPPAELAVRVIDEVSGQAVETGELQWHPARPEGVSGGGLERAVWDATAEVHRIRAPAGAIELMLWAWEFQPYSETLELGLVAREHTVRLRRGCGLVLRLLDGETPVAFPDGWADEPQAVGGTGRTTLIQFGGFERKFMVSEPGTYTLELPSISGYQPIPPQTIEIQAGQFTQRAVALERIR